MTPISQIRQLVTEPHSQEHEFYLHIMKSKKLIIITFSINGYESPSLYCDLIWSSFNSKPNLKTTQKWIKLSKQRFFIQLYVFPMIWCSDNFLKIHLYFRRIWHLGSFGGISRMSLNQPLIGKMLLSFAYLSSIINIRTW